MTIENQQFNIDSSYYKKLAAPILSRTVILSQDSSLKPDELESFSQLISKSQDEQVLEINSNASIYSSKFISILNKTKSIEIIEKIFYWILEINDLEIEKDGSNELISSLLELKKIDKSLPYSSILKHLDSQELIVQLQAAYLLTVLIAYENSNEVDDSTILKLYESINKFVVNEDDELEIQLIGTQLLVKILSFKQNRKLYWLKESEYVSNLYQLLNRTKDLQLKYNCLLLIWLLTFDSKVAVKLPELYKDIINKYLSLAQNSIKEKIARLSISTLLNFLKVEDEKKSEAIIKIFLYEKSIDIFNKLKERKWADEDLKNDISLILEILNEAVISLTTFDEYEIELSKKKFNWSPPHKSEEFWIDNIDKFKQNNFKIVKQLIELLKEEGTDSSEQTQLNQTIICHDLGMIVKHCPEVIKFLEKNSDLKYSIMSLMNSKYTDVKYEALKTTQILVSNSFAS